MMLDGNVDTRIEGDVVFIEKKQKNRDRSEGCLNIKVDMNMRSMMKFERYIGKKKINIQWLFIDHYIGGGSSEEKIEHSVSIRLRGDKVYITKLMDFGIIWDIIIDVSSEIIEFYRKIDGEEGYINVKHLHINDYMANNC